MYTMYTAGLQFDWFRLCSFTILQDFNPRTYVWQYYNDSGNEMYILLLW